jgi:hypothetical protein
MYRGDHKTFELSVKDSDNVAVNITGATLTFSVKNDPNDPTALISKSTAVVTEIALTTPVNGLAEIYLLPADTRDLEAGTYVYDVQIVTAASKKHTLVRANLILLDDVTQT